MDERIIIIKYKSEVTKENTDFLIAQGAKIINVIKSINAIITRVPIDKIRYIISQPNVEYAEDDKTAMALNEKLLKKIEQSNQS